MRTTITFTASDYAALRQHLLRSEHQEEAAILTAGVSQTDERLNLVVREITLVPEDGFTRRGSAFLDVKPEFMAPIIKRCRLDQMAFLLTHSHPFTRHGVSFSAIDDSGERQLIPKVHQRVPGLPHGTIVFGQESLDARLWFPDKDAPQSVDRVRVIGDRLMGIQPTSARSTADVIPAWDKEVYARQILVFGEAGQE
jgi:hypothetical protein